MKDLLITLLNTAFWFGLHFGTAGAVCALPKDVQTRWFDPNRRFFTVSDWEMRVFLQDRSAEMEGPAAAVQSRI